MAETGKAAVFSGPGKPFEIRELPVPDVAPDGVLVKVTAAVICGSDLHVWRNDSGRPWDRDPVIMGHEFTGVVAKLGTNVRTDSLRRPLKEGDRVAFPFFFPCHNCYWCVRGEHHSCPYRSRPNFQGVNKYPYADGGYSEYFYLQPGAYKFRVPDEVPDAAVAPVNCALAQVLFGLEKVRVHFGDTVVIQGAGGLGIYATAVARDMGASRVIVIDGQKNRLELATRCGASDTVDMSVFKTPEERVARVKELTGGIGADVVVEVVGVAAATIEGLDMVRLNGKYLDIGNISGGRLDLPANKVISGQIQWTGVQHYNPWIIESALQFLARTRETFPLTNVVSDRFPLEKINEAFEFAEWQGKTAGSRAQRVVLNP